MVQIPSALQYIFMTTSATILGVLFMIAVENMAGYRYRYVLAVTSSLLLSPIGAWVVSLFVKLSLLNEGRGGASA